MRDKYIIYASGLYLTEEFTPDLLNPYDEDKVLNYIEEHITADYEYKPLEDVQEMIWDTAVSLKNNLVFRSEVKTRFMQIRETLSNYIADVNYWQSLDLSSVNHYTNGTPEFNSKEELKAYVQKLEKLLKDL